MWSFQIIYLSVKFTKNVLYPDMYFHLDMKIPISGNETLVISHSRIHDISRS